MSGRQAVRMLGYACAAAWGSSSALAQLTGPDVSSLSNSDLTSLVTAGTTTVNYGLRAAAVITGVGVVIAIIWFVAKNIKSKGKG